MLEKHSWHRDIQEGNVWDRAKGYAAEKFFTGYPTDDQTRGFEPRARAEITKREKDNDWQYAMNVVHNAGRFGSADTKVRDDFVVPQMRRRIISERCLPPLNRLAQTAPVRVHPAARLIRVISRDKQALV